MAATKTVQHHLDLHVHGEDTLAFESLAVWDMPGDRVMELYRWLNDTRSKTTMGVFLCGSRIQAPYEVESESEDLLEGLTTFALATDFKITLIHKLRLRWLAFVCNDTTPWSSPDISASWIVSLVSRQRISRITFDFFNGTCGPLSKSSDDYTTSPLIDMFTYIPEFACREPEVVKGDIPNSLVYGTLPVSDAFIRDLLRRLEDELGRKGWSSRGTLTLLPYTKRMIPGIEFYRKVPRFYTKPSELDFCKGIVR
ncbi:uncharacterized protein FIBRA_03370 [Fibroporia radiculosa]|uniref:Uncharacterized protein n=1 Tax=Fibroporia radiculosa TaxID=599839 RepID=J4I9K5_9APHY|nr:uncharacterized protein FIBRA_03370 [Fibroporia radiculosa]CCM01321.1 predicted protein [Fibroporia radiculosa]